jgi:gliding motility-associated-like protein
MKSLLKKSSFITALLVLNLFSINSNAQCLQIESILVDACVSGGACSSTSGPCTCEGRNEMVLFKVGASPINTTSLTPTWPNNSFRGWAQNANTAADVATLNATIIKCGYLKEPVGNILPANSEVLIITSWDMCTGANSFANLQDTLIVLFQDTNNFQGHFVNQNNGTTVSAVPTGPVLNRTLTLAYPPLACSESVTYHPHLLVNNMGTYGGSSGQNDGATVLFDALGNATYVNNGCRAPYIPTVVTATAPSTVCVNASANIDAVISGSVATYSWSTSGTGTLSVSSGTLSSTVTNSVSTTYTPAPGESGTITFTVTAQGKCSLAVTTNTVSINVIALPSPTITSSNGTVICNGNSTVLSVTNQTGVTYAWNPGAGSGTSFTVAPNAQTIYTLTATNSCAAINSTYTVDVNALPAVSVASASVCPGFTATITASGASTYTWNTSVTGSTLSDAPATTTTYTATGTDVNGCVNTGTGTITIYNSPTVTVNSPATCVGGTVTLNASGAATFTWSTTQNGNSISVSPGSSANYTVTGTDANGCDNFAVAAVTINPLPTVIVNSATICPGNTATLTASGASTYTWNTTATGASISDNPASNTSYTVTATDINGCVNTATASIAVVNSLTVSSVPASTVVCNGSSTTISASGASTYSWSPAGSLSSSSGITVTASPTIQTTYTVVGSSGACKDSSVVTINVNPLPIVTVNAATVCAGNSATLNAGGASTYIWSTTQIGNSISVSPASTTPYTVTGTDANGCISQQTTTVTVNALPMVNATSPSVCQGSFTIITASGATTYTWSTTQTGNSISVSPVSNTSYTVLGTDANGCVGQYVTSVTVHPTPTVTVNNSSVCIGNPAILSASGASTYTWTPAATGSSITVNPTTNTSYSVIGTDANGCISNVAISNVTVNPLPTAAFSPSVLTGQAPATVVFTNQSTGAAPLLNYWNFANGDSSATQNPSETYSLPGTYNVILTITDANGCKDTAGAIIVVNDVPVIVIIPNVFSPNGDSINDVFYITATGISNFNCKIYDRWGIFLYEWSDVKGGWDGKNNSNGKEVTDGTYYFILSYSDNKSKPFTKQGYLQLVR